MTSKGTWTNWWVIFQTMRCLTTAHHKGTVAWILSSDIVRYVNLRNSENTSPHFQVTWTSGAGLSYGYDLPQQVCGATATPGGAQTLVYSNVAYKSVML